MSEAGVTELGAVGSAGLPRVAFVRSTFLVRLVEVFGILRKATLFLTVVAAAVFLSPVLGAVLALFALVGWSGRRRIRRAPATSEAALVVEGDSLLVVRGGRGVRRIPLAAMRSGRVTPDANGSHARVVVRDRTGAVLDADLTAREGRALLRDLGLSARERPMTFAFFFGMRVTVGADGILVAWPLLRRRRFVRYADIADVRAVPGVIVLTLRDGGRYEIATATNAKSPSALDEHNALLERIEDAREARRQDEESGASLSLALARGGRSARAWVKDLAAMSEASGTGYRAATLPKETLWRVALDPTEPEELRIGASLTLRADLDEEGRTRLRAAAEASASPRVRVALAGAADALDDEALGDAIANPARAKQARHG